MDETIKAIEGLNSAFQQFQTKNDERLQQIEKDGAASAELNAEVKRLAEAMHQFEVKAARPPVAPAPEAKGDNEPAEVKAALVNYLRKGRGNLTADEVKLLSTSDDTQAGYLAPRQMVNEVIRAVTEMSPIRTVARIIPTSAKGIEIPRRTGLVTATWAGDGATVTASNSTYGMERIDANMLMAVTEISVEMLEDAAFDLQGFIQADMAEQFAAAEGLAFVSGSGTGRPQGLLTATGLGEYANGHASALQADAITGVTFDIKTEYARNATFALNRNTLFAVYTLKDGQGQYLYSPNQDVGKAPTIQGRPYIECPDMPDIASDAYPILYGDFRRGYVIADRVQLAVVRDETTKADQGVVRFVGRKRVGGQTVLAEAFSKLKIATSV
jgi:HK97 family phage major capsid protein